MKKVDLGNDSLKKLLLRLAIPAMLAQFVNVLYSIVDRVFISNISGYGDIALAGVGVCAPIITLITSFSFLFGLGGAPLVAIKMGEKDTKGGQAILANCFFMLIVVSAILTGLFLFIKQPMLMFFGASEATIVYANQYLTIYIIGSIFAILSIGLNSFIICQGFSGMSMISIVIGAVLNIVLDPLFIFVFNMGVSGAALATIISQCVSCIFIILFLLSKKSNLKLSFKGLSLKIISKITKLGVSPFLIVATDSLVIIIFNMMLKQYGGASMGDTYIIVATIVVSFMQLVNLPMNGITMGCQPAISFNYGAKNLARVKNAFYGVNLICIVFTTIMFVFAMSIPQVFIRIFTSNTEIINLSVWGIRVNACGIIFLAVQYGCVDSLTALNRPVAALALSFTRKIAIMTTLLLVLPIFFGAKGVFYAEPISDIASCIISGTVSLLILRKILRKKVNTINTLK